MYGPVRTVLWADGGLIAPSDPMESAAAAEELKSQAEQLGTVVGNLVALVGGGTAAKESEGDEGRPTDYRETRLSKRAYPALIEKA